MSAARQSSAASSRPVECVFYLRSGPAWKRIHSGGDTTFNRLSPCRRRRSSAAAPVGQQHKYEASPAASAALDPAHRSELRWRWRSLFLWSSGIFFFLKKLQKLISVSDAQWIPLSVFSRLCLCKLNLSFFECRLSPGGSRLWFNHAPFLTKGAEVYTQESKD